MRARSSRGPAVSEAPEQELAEVAAIAIGVGSYRESDAANARDIYDRECQPQRVRDPRRTLTAITIARFTAAVGCVAAELAWKQGTLGLAVTSGFLGLCFLWWASPTRNFPGVAVESSHREGRSAFGSGPTL